LVIGGSGPSICIGSGSNTWTPGSCPVTMDKQYMVLNGIDSNFEFYVSGSECTSPTILFDNSLSGNYSKNFPGIQLFDALLYMTGSEYAPILFNNSENVI